MPIISKMAPQFFPNGVSIERSVDYSTTNQKKSYFVIFDKSLNRKRVKNQVFSTFYRKIAQISNGFFVQSIATKILRRIKAKHVQTFSTPPATNTPKIHDFRSKWARFFCHKSHLSGPTIRSGRLTNAGLQSQIVTKTFSY